MKTYYIHIYALVLRVGIDLEVTDTIRVDELRRISAQFMEKETYGQFLAHTNNHLLRCCDHTFMKGSCILRDIQLRNGECFYLF